jgi:hypothetical protein
MSSTQEEIREMKDAALRILEMTEKRPSKIVIGYDYHKECYNQMSRSDPRMVIEWMGDD